MFFYGYYTDAAEPIDKFVSLQNSQCVARYKWDVKASFIDIVTHSWPYPILWVILVDKSYPSGTHICGVIHREVNPPHGQLTVDEEWYNMNNSSIRIIVEHVLGRLCSLWKVLSSKCFWSTELYDHVFRFLLAATNLHTFRHPLRKDEPIIFRRYINIIFTLSVKKQEQDDKTYKRDTWIRLNEGFQSVLNLYRMTNGMMTHKNSYQPRIASDLSI